MFGPKIAVIFKNESSNYNQRLKVSELNPFRQSTTELELKYLQVNVYSSLCLDVLKKWPIFLKIPKQSAVLIYYLFYFRIGRLETEMFLY